jgi:hypothetical protein
MLYIAQPKMVCFRQLRIVVVRDSKHHVHLWYPASDRNSLITPAKSYVQLLSPSTKVKFSILKVVPCRSNSYLNLSSLLVHVSWHTSLDNYCLSLRNFVPTLLIAYSYAAELLGRSFVTLTKFIGRETPLHRSQRQYLRLAGINGRANAVWTTPRLSRCIN